MKLLQCDPIGCTGNDKTTANAISAENGAFMYGKFIENTAGYEINTFDLPTSWEYIYENKDILLKVDQFGPVYAQANPPGDIMLFKREQHQKYSPWSVGITTENGKSFGNFYKPCDKAVKAENVQIRYLPECASYRFEYDGLAVETEIFIPSKSTTVVYRLKITNVGTQRRKLQVNPQLVPYLNDAVIAPWDKYEWYLDTSCKRDEYITVSTKLLNANAEKGKRRHVYFVSETENSVGYEISFEKYIGYGDVYNPDRNYTNSERIYAYPPIYAVGYDWELAEGETKCLTQVLSLDSSDVGDYFRDECYMAEKSKRKAEFDRLFAKNEVRTGDKAFDYYANYWIPMQMNWVASLDRGWPTGMRGTRDSAQDYAALLYMDTESCRDIILTMLECQRTDGWFPRQYSANGKHGKHDLRGHVDGGAFFAEFIWKYLAHTRDFAILDKKVEWLDSDECSTVWEHTVRAVEYYISDSNIGEHGLCKIREGDWLDAVNRAGVEGRGESVTVSEQTVMSLRYIIDIAEKTNREIDRSKYLAFAELLKENINKHAFNAKNFYNGCFNDGGQWIFSECDPDGEERIYGVSNYYAVISGTAAEEKYPYILHWADKLKCDKGYRLFYPPLGDKPIDNVGRIASGDAPAFMGENANVYNHGSQGFLARALAVMGERERLFDTLKWIMPYDTDKHPTDKTFTPPYAIVNCYQQLPGFDHRGLMCFLTGSVAMAMRGVYEWLMGVRPCLDGIEFAPCVPSETGEVEAKFEFLDKTYRLKVKDGRVWLDGCELNEKRCDMITGKDVYFVPIERG